VNADYVLSHSLWQYKTHPFVLVTYDIACQYVKKIVKRFQKHSPELVNAVTKAIVAVPKLHVQGHKDNCQYQYALPYIFGAGNLGGETIETTWAELNKLVYLQEVGPVARHDGCNNQLGDINW
jgi:hypothetical protein